MDEPKSPEDILDEIMNGRPGSSPSPTSYPPEFEPPPEDIPLPPRKAPENAAKPDWAARLLPWLCLMLGCALLVLGVCVLQVAKVNDRLDTLEQAVESVQAVDSLQKENKQLQQALEDAQNEAEVAKEGQEQLESILTTYEGNSIQIRLLSYLFYIEQFMDNGDAPMAALIVGLSADPYFSLLYDSYSRDYDIPGNFETYLGRYLSYKHTLIEEGYLEEQSESDEPFSPLTFAQLWDPEQNSDMAALGLLWCVMDEYYACGDSHTAVQFLVEYQDYPLRGTEDGCLAHLSRIASNYTSIQYELLIAHMQNQGYLVEQNGRYDYGTFEGSWVDVLYLLPFDPACTRPQRNPLKLN